jgi:hypothetical protein
MVCGERKRKIPRIGNTSFSPHRRFYPFPLRNLCLFPARGRPAERSANHVGHAGPPRLRLPAAAASAVKTAARAELNCLDRLNTLVAECRHYLDGLTMGSKKNCSWYITKINHT